MHRLVSNIAIFLGAFISAESFAKRTFITPHIVRRAALSYPDPSPTSPVKVGAVLHTYIVVMNISEIRQNVTVSLSAGSMAYTSSDDPNIDICVFSEEASSITAKKILILNPGQVVSKEIALEPYTIKQVSFKAAISRDWPTPNRNWHVLFYPVIKFVAGDRGAITANVAIHTEGVLTTAGAGAPPCNITGAADTIWSPPSESVNLADPQVQVNGGKPF